MIVILVVATALVTCCIVTFFYKRKLAKLREADSQHAWEQKLIKSGMEAATDVLYLIDKNLRMQEVANFEFEVAPISQNDVIGEHACKYLEEEYVEEVTRIIEKAFTTDEVLVANYTVLVGEERFYFEGRFRRVDENWVVCRSKNLTELFMHERAILDANKKLEKAQKVNQLILSNANCGLVYIDTNFMVQFENLHAVSKDGFDREYKRGEYCYQRVKGRSTPCEDCLAKKAFQSKTIEKADLTINEDLFLEVTASPVLGVNDNCIGVVLKYDNITDRQRIASELKCAKETAEAAAKLKAQFLANMSHEIRTPLNAIVGFSDLLISTEEGSERQEYISIIRRNNELLLQLFNDILDLSKIESDRLEFTFSNMNVNAMLRSLVASTKLRFGKKKEVDIVFNEPKEDSFIYTEENRVLQVLFNLVNNAIKFTNEGRIEVGYEWMDKGIRFYVSDTGKGIPVEKQADIFKRFVKLDQFATGTGLGLPICELIVKRLNGEIGVESIEGEGSTFWFTLPVEPLAISR